MTIKGIVDLTPAPLSGELLTSKQPASRMNYLIKIGGRLLLECFGLILFLTVIAIAYVIL